MERRQEFIHLGIRKPLKTGELHTLSKLVPTVCSSWMISSKQMQPVSSPIAFSMMRLSFSSVRLSLIMAYPRPRISSETVSSVGYLRINEGTKTRVTYPHVMKFLTMLRYLRFSAVGLRKEAPCTLSTRMARNTRRLLGDASLALRLSRRRKEANEPSDSNDQQQVLIILRNVFHIHI